MSPASSSHTNTADGKWLRLEEQPRRCDYCLLWSRSIMWLIMGLLILLIIAFTVSGNVFPWSNEAGVRGTGGRVGLQKRRETVQRQLVLQSFDEDVCLPCDDEFRACNMDGKWTCWAGGEETQDAEHSSISDFASVPDNLSPCDCVLPGEQPIDETMSFNNCCLTITDIATPDPYVISAFGRYYMTFTSGDKVEIWSSSNLLDFGRACQRVTVWRPPPHTHYSGGIWAPELHALEGRWYIYVAAEDPKHGNKSHRMYVLGGPPSNYDPVSGPWEFLGPIAGMPDHWAIDGTILSLWGKNYFIYSGWPFHNPGMSDLIQELFIIELASPTRACSQAVSICQPNEPFERTGNHGINEGPQALIHPDGQSWVGIAYSCSGSWTKEYKVNTLRYNGGDPLQQSSWEKSRHPLIQGRMRGGAPYGPGHGSFLNVSGDTVLVYHATDKEDDGWNNRKARIQRVQWTQNGPWMGEVGPLVDTVQHYMSPPQGMFAGFPGNQHQPQFDPKVEAMALLGKAKGFLKKF